MKEMQSNSIDLIITDPPYGIDGDTLDKHYNRNDSCVLSGYVEVPKEKYQEFSNNWIKECERILKPSGSIYIISGYSNLYHILNALHDTNLIERNHIVWKYNFGVYTSKKYVSSHYHILYWVKPPVKNICFNTSCRYENSKESYHDREDVWIIPREYKTGEIRNQNELPRNLLQKIISYSSNENDTILDCFAGGGSTLLESKSMNRNSIGFELNPKACELINRRIDAIS